MIKRLISIVIAMMLVPLSLFPVYAAGIVESDVSLGYSESPSLSVGRSVADEVVFVSDVGGPMVFAVEQPQNYWVYLFMGNSDVGYQRSVASDGTVDIPSGWTNITGISITPKTSTSYPPGNTTIVMDFDSNIAGLRNKNAEVRVRTPTTYYSEYVPLEGNIGGYRLRRSIVASGSWELHDIAFWGISPAAGPHATLKINRLDMGGLVSEEAGLLGGISQGIENLYNAITQQDYNFSSMLQALISINGDMNENSAYLMNKLTNMQTEVAAGFVMLGTGLQAVMSTITTAGMSVEVAILGQTSSLQGAINAQRDAIVARLTAFSSEMQGYITVLGDRLEGFFSDDSLDDLSDDANSGISYQEGQEKAFFDDAMVYYDTVDPSELHISAQFINAMSYVNSVFMNVFNQLGDYRLLVLLPMTLGIMKVIFGRSSEVINMNNRYVRSERRYAARMEKMRSMERQR